MIRINLVPDVKQEFLRAERTRRIAISISILVIIGAAGMVALLGSFWGVQSVRSELTQKGIEEEYAALSKTKDVNELVTIQNQLNHIDAIDASKTRDSRIFGVLQAIDPGGKNSVRFNNVRLDPQETILSLEGVADNGYAAVELLKKTITNTKLELQEEGQTVTEDLATEVVVGESSFGEDSNGKLVLRFNLQVSYNSRLFTNEVKNIKIVRPQGKLDLTDSRLRVPESLFANTVKDQNE